MRSERNRKCDKCKLEFKDNAWLYDHMEKVHLTEMNYTCTCCSKTFTKASNFYKHIKSEHYGISYACNDCEMIFKKELQFNNHLKEEHHYIDCEKCSKVIKKGQKHTCFKESIICRFGSCGGNKSYTVPSMFYKHLYYTHRIQEFMGVRDALLLCQHRHYFIESQAKNSELSSFKATPSTKAGGDEETEDSLESREEAYKRYAKEIEIKLFLHRALISEKGEKISESDIPFAIEVPFKKKPIHSKTQLDMDFLRELERENIQIKRKREFQKRIIEYKRQKATRKYQRLYGHMVDTFAKNLEEGDPQKLLPFRIARDRRNANYFKWRGRELRYPFFQDTIKMAGLNLQQTKVFQKNTIKELKKKYLGRKVTFGENNIQLYCTICKKNDGFIDKDDLKQHISSHFQEGIND